ncbi:MAG: tRNA (adenosine(37)-N6)-threonylcarbamoyltransferase complex ATPase subunit type 1 TsaE [Holosporales bacterium]|jgi:tRNA threonylcarbamoyladenosine biosynthesis protein TsaE|nr:tRNA (adenosine(37)-N6)-threonylcarbamoyltransferase complex ATPase subunit type 1 TsaE [Holosporales bacterium]
MHKYTIDQLKKKAVKLAQDVQPPFSILLFGDVGVGKTTFSKFFITRLIVDKRQNVTSPTFNVVQIYESIKGPIWHVDLYRLTDEKEIFQLGLIEAMHEHICLIEWPNFVQEYATNCNCIELSL